MKYQFLPKVSVCYKMMLVIISVVFFLVPYQKLNAQTLYRASSYNLKVSGTSNVHDWNMKVSKATLNALFALKQDGTLALSGLNDLSFSMQVKALKSDHDLMDTRAYNTLNADKNANIIFKLASATVVPQPNNQYLIKALGNLLIAGVSREVTLVANGHLNADKSITVAGSKSIKMSDFQVKPPSYMFGAMKVGDEVTIQYNIKFNN